jgi:DNA replication protein DnaC
MLEQNTAGENPFCTRRIRPGAVPFYFPAGMDVENLIDRLRRNQWRGEIVGPHGSGKSTLLASILKAVEQAGWEAVCFELHDGQRSMPRDWRRKTKTAAISRPAIVAVDGYEQLSLWNRFRLKSYCRRRHLGLLVTSHSTTGLPEIFRTSASLEMALQIVEKIMQNEHITVPANIIADSLARHDADIREMLFDLYDYFEQQRNSPQQ